MTTQQTPVGDSVSEVRQALGWAPADGPEEQAAHARMGGATEPDNEPAPAQPEPTPEPSAPPATPAPVPASVAINAEAQAKAEQTRIDNANRAALAYKNQLIAQKWDENAAHQAAVQYARNHYLEAQNRELSQANERQAQVDTAQHFGTQYGVDPALLLEYHTPAAMEAAAKHYKAQNDRIEKIAGNPTPRTPVQQFDSGSGGGMTDQQKKIAYATGQIDLTTDEYHRLYRR